VKWIEGSKHTGKDNYAWYRFAADHVGGPIFHPKGSAPESRASNAASPMSHNDPVRGSAPDVQAAPCKLG
jgi:hypothetical protein